MLKSFKFGGYSSEYFSIWIVNILMEIITLGFYRPWSKVRNREYFYANTVLEGRNFGYHATGTQLVIAYIVAVVFFFVYTFFDKNASLGWLFLGLSFLFLPWLVWRSMKFNARVTSFSSIRFKFNGTLKEAFWIYGVLAFAAMLFGGLIPGYFIYESIEAKSSSIEIQMLAFIIIVCLVVSLYIFGVMQKKMNEYMLGNMQYGLSKFSTNFQTKEFLKIVFNVSVLALVIVLGVIVGLILFALAVHGVEGLMSFVAGIEQSRNVDMERSVKLMGVLGVIIIMIGGMYLYSYWIAKKREYVFANTVLDGSVGFRSRLTPAKLMYVIATNYLVVLLSFGFARPVAKVRMARAKVNNTDISGDVDLNSFIGERVKEESALGEEIGDVFDVDFDVGF